jgi:hypothetical protein
MHERTFWLYLECGHRVKWRDSSERGDGKVPGEAPCPEASIPKHGLQRVYRVEAIEELEPP